MKSNCRAQSFLALKRFFLLRKEINRGPTSNQALHSRHSYRAMVPLIYRCNDWIRHKETPDTGTCLFPGFQIPTGNSNLIPIKTSGFESEPVLRKTRVYYACSQLVPTSYTAITCLRGGSCHFQSRTKQLPPPPQAAGLRSGGETRPSAAHTCRLALCALGGRSSCYV